jgi:serine/threonine protein kinase
MSENLSLEVVGGDTPPAQLPAQGKLVIGSSTERADFVVAGQGVADVHCAIGRLKGGGWALQDLGSDFGTLVNGSKVTSVRLNAEDRIHLGSRSLRVFDPAQADAAPLRAAAPKKQATPPSRMKAAAPKASKVQIPGYRIERTLGRGSMGDVYLAVQESLARQVALKVLSPRIEADIDFVQRFQAEAQTAAALNHPNVVTVFDVGEANGHHYLSMEYMDGGCLESRVTRGTLTWREMLTVLHDAASGLVYAEQRGIVHRDIKPANLMQNESGATKIADLGLATQVEQDVVQAEGGKVYGTPHFIAPELIRGGTPDCRSDLYSLGATAYRLLTGHTPFEGANATDILRGALRDNPIPVVQRAPGTPVGVAALVERLLEKDPADRHPSAAVLVEEIARLRGTGGQNETESSPFSKKLIGWVVAVGLLGMVGLIAKSMLGGGSSEPDPVPAGAGNGNGGTAEVEGGPNDGNPGDTGNPGTPEDNGNDTEIIDPLEVFELQAKEAFAKLSDSVLEPAQRVIELRNLALEFAGSDAAAAGDALATSLEAQLISDASPSDPRAREIAKMLSDLGEKAALGSVPPRPDQALRAMRAVPGQILLQGVLEFEGPRGELERAVLQEALDFVRQQIEAAVTSAHNGNFEEMAALLTDAIAATGLPDFESGTEPAEARQLRQLGLGARQRLDAIDDARALFQVRRGQEDDSLVAAGFNGRAGLEAELLSLDLAAAKTRAESILATVKTDDSRLLLTTLIEDLGFAIGALESLAGAFGKNEWRRKSVADPRSRRTVRTRDAVGADATGLTLAESGSNVHVPWSAWGGSTENLHALFHERLKRTWSADEKRGIGAILRLTAVAHAIQLASEMFDPDVVARFSPGEADELMASFDAASNWAKIHGGSASVARERGAARNVVDAVQAASDKHWARAVASTTRLLEENRDTLIMRLLSDGSDFGEAEEASSTDAPRADDVEPPPPGGDPPPEAPDAPLDPDSTDSTAGD